MKKIVRKPSPRTLSEDEKKMVEKAWNERDIVKIFMK